MDSYVKIVLTIIAGTLIMIAWPESQIYFFWTFGIIIIIALCFTYIGLLRHCFFETAFSTAAVAFFFYLLFWDHHFSPKQELIFMMILPLAIIGVWVARFEEKRRIRLERERGVLK